MPLNERAYPWAVGGSAEQLPETIQVLAHRSSATEPEALVCERVQYRNRADGALRSPLVRCFGLRRVAGIWLIVAEGGPMADRTSSRCTAWLGDRFNRPDLSNFGETPCGAVD